MLGGHKIRGVREEPTLRVWTSLGSNTCPTNSWLGASGKVGNVSVPLPRGAYCCRLLRLAGDGGQVVPVLRTTGPTEAPGCLGVVLGSCLCVVISALQEGGLYFP
jgi:hypothetical protein